MLERDFMGLLFHAFLARAASRSAMESPRTQIEPVDDDMGIPSL
jgi:hypothetical protein